MTSLPCQQFDADTVRCPQRFETVPQLTCWWGGGSQGLRHRLFRSPIWLGCASFVRPPPEATFLMVLKIAFVAHGVRDRGADAWNDAESDVVVPQPATR